MKMQVEVVYEDGVLKPDSPLPLAEHERLTVTYSGNETPVNRTRLASEFMEHVRRKLEKMGPAPGLDEVRRRLSKIPGSLSDDFDAEREGG